MKKAFEFLATCLMMFIAGGLMAAMILTNLQEGKMITNINVNVKASSIDGIEVNKNEKTVTMIMEDLRLTFNNSRIDIKVGDNKAKVMLSDIIEALADAIDTGDFEIDEIDSVVWATENALEEARE